MNKARRLRFLVCILGTIALALMAVGCGEVGNALTGDGPRVLSVGETKHLLRQLPYRYEFRQVAIPKGADAAVAGRAIGAHHTVLNFGISLGDGHIKAVPVPRAGTEEIVGYPRANFVFTTDTLFRAADGRLKPSPFLKTAAQSREATSMEIEMTDKLCVAATGDHCPI